MADRVFLLLLLALVTHVVSQEVVGEVARAEASLAIEETEVDGDGGGDKLEEDDDENMIIPTTGSSLMFIRDLKNLTREVGENLKVKCEVEGDPAATRFRWFKNEAPLQEEQGRVKVKDSVKGGKTQWSILRFRELETLDTGFYRCEASNPITTIKSTSVIKVNLGSGGGKRRGSFGDYGNDDYVHLPGTFDDPFQSMNSLTNGIDGLPAHIELQGRRQKNPNSQSFVSNSETNDLPSLTPDEKKGKCQRYVGSVCSKVVGDNYVFVSMDQHFVEQKLAATFSVITASPDMSSRCAEFAIPAICHSTFPLCDLVSQRPRKLCRDECEVLEQDVCKTELAIAKSHPLIQHQMSLPECEELPAIGTMASHNCVQLGIPGLGQLVQPHSCYTGDGDSYRGTHAMTLSGAVCKPWKEQIIVEPFPNHKEIVGGHNYCRNPDGAEKMDEPWCFTNDRSATKQVCGISQCSEFNLWLYVVLPASVALVSVAVILAICCMRGGGKKPHSVSTSSPRSFMNPSSVSSQHNHSEMEMNSLLPPGTLATKSLPKVRAREFPISAVRFVQEMGDGVFGKVYRGELGGIVGGSSTLVAVKTLKLGANQQTRSDFQRDSELMADLRHPNIVCLLGVVLKDEPACLIFEHMSQGDLHEYLLMHSPKSQEMPLSLSTSGEEGEPRVLDHGDMAYIAIQVASGMEYLASHHYVHRDLAARNCLVGQNMVVKISDFGLSRDIYAADYYRMQTKSLVPLRWMPPESIFFGKFAGESDVWSYGILLWEVYSYGLQPFYGYSNQEVIEMVRSRQLLPCPEDCPSRMYAFMVECWHELPNRRPTFTEIHARLRQWEGMSCGYQSTHSNSQSMCGQSDHSTSQHSSTGPSNNTGSTSLSNQREGYGGGYARPFQHLPQNGGPVGMTVQMTGNGGPGVHSMLVGQVGPYSSHGHSSSSNMYTPLTNGLGVKSVSSNGPHSVASLQMV